MRGLPGSGKTTWAREQTKDSPSTIRVNKDDLRKMLFGDSEHKSWHENLVLEIRDNIIRNALDMRKNIIVDDTNFNPVHEDNVSAISQAWDVAFSVKNFSSGLHNCIANDLKRPDSVGETVIRQMHDKYVRPGLRVEQNPDLDDAVIFDIDGTLALLNGRDPHNTEYQYDSLNQRVYEELMHRKSGGHKIILCTGRSSKFIKETDQWLGKNGIIPDLFLMRKEGDMRQDAVVKREMFMRHILPKYYVNCVYEDRQRVVDMWRDLGLTVFQVDDGRF